MSISNKIIKSYTAENPNYNFYSVIGKGLWATASEIHAGAACALMLPWTFTNTYHQPPTDQRDGTPILLLNGYGGFGSTWEGHKKSLAKAGLGPIYTMNVQSLVSIKTNAKQVQAVVERIQRETGSNDLILIGHSKGGLVAAYYATVLANKGQANIEKVITLGSPFRGSPIAHLGIGKDAAEMRPGSDLLKDLQERIQTSTRPIFFHIGSTMDLVAPVGSALLGNNSEHELCIDYVGHTGLLFDRMVTDKVIEWIKKPKNIEMQTL
jgi:triacylglycerol esterase/lipase EstA (alpha/beta hydrolase family)